MATSLNLIKRANEIQERVPSPEYILGKGLLQPANNTNSGPRKIMQGIQKEQSIQLCNPETAIYMLGYENQFGELSSNFIKTDREYIVLDKIYKNPMQYWLIVQDLYTEAIHVFKRVTYEHVTETYGHTLDTTYLDSLSVSSIIPKGIPIIKPTSYDSAMNKCDGVNLSTVYLAMGENTEDPIVLSESAAKKLVSPLYSTIQLIINDNDIPLNLYGNDKDYKSFPDIGEEIKNSILCGVRRERKDDEALYCQSVQHLKELMVSDTSYIANGTLVDIDINCNNVENLSSVYNTQIAYYWNKKIEYCTQIIKSVERILKSKGSNTVLTYDLTKLYDTAKRVVSGELYIKDKVFNNIIIEMVVKEDKGLHRGDKITDRYAGKGVASDIWPDDKMPKYMRNGELKTVDAIYNSSTIINRENPGQSFETEFIFVGEKIMERITSMFKEHKSYDALVEVLKESEGMIYKYLSILSPAEAKDYIDYINKISFDERLAFIDSYIDAQEIYIVIKPISGHANIDMLRKLYAAFPWIDMDYLYVPVNDSNGNRRVIQTRRKVITGKKYIYRLKQISEEKFSAVSLASTNLRGENMKTKANKQHRIAYANTPVKIGNMEVGNLMDALDLTLFVPISIMLLSSSQVLRRSVYQLLTGDPFNPTIKFDGTNITAVSRSAEKVYIYFKAIGLKLKCEVSKPEIKSPVLFDAVQLLPSMDMPKSKYVMPFLNIPYYINGANLNELVELYIKTNQDKLPQNAIEIVSNGKVITSPQFEMAKDEVIKIAHHCENIDEVKYKILNPEKKLKNAIFTMPVILMPGGMD